MKLTLKHIVLVTLFLLGSVELSAQSITISGSGTGSPDPSAILDLNDTTRGFLPPRVTTTQMNNISSPAAGLLVYNSDSAGYFYYNSSAWVSIGSSSLAAGELYTSGGNVGIGTTTPVFDFEVAGSEGKQITTINVGTVNSIDDLAIGDTSNVVRITGDGSANEITGIQGGVDGRIIHLINSTGSVISIRNEDGGSIVANRFFIRGGNDKNMDEFQISSFIYSSLDGGWLLMSEH